MSVKRTDHSTDQFPSLFGNLFHVHDRFHEGCVTQADFRYPDGAEKMRPSRRICLLERAIGIGTEDTSLVDINQSEALKETTPPGNSPAFLDQSAGTSDRATGLLE